jgi:hypothetical protein
LSYQNDEETQKMKKRMMVFVVLLMAVALVPVLAANPAYAGTGEDDACWGQATAVFAATGEMGQHASEQPTPRLGLRNLAQALYEDNVISEASLQALGAFVAAELGLSIDACD